MKNRSRQAEKNRVRADFRFDGRVGHYGGLLRIRFKFRKSRKLRVYRLPAKGIRTFKIYLRAER